RLPFVEPVGRDQTAPAPEGSPKRRLLVRGFGTRIDQLVPNRNILRPRWHQPPAVKRQRGWRFIGSNRDSLRRRDRIAWLNPLRDGRQAEHVAHNLRISGQGKPPAHWRLLS